MSNDHLSPNTSSEQLNGQSDLFLLISINSSKIFLKTTCILKVVCIFTLAKCKLNYSLNFKTNKNEQKYFSYWCKFWLWITYRKRASQKGLQCNWHKPKP